MSSPSAKPRCPQAELASACALEALPASEAAALQAHAAACTDCRDRLANLRSIVSSFVYWPTDVLRPSADLEERLAKKMRVETGREFSSARSTWIEPEWEQVAPGIRCKLLARDLAANRISMLVHLDAGVEYPPHTHAGVEELHLLDGELWIEERLLRPGDFNRAEPGTGDKRVYSETGCTCVLVTSSEDVLG